MSETRVIPSVTISKMLEIVDFKEEIKFLLMNNEEVELAFSNNAGNDNIWFTNKRIIIYITESGLWGNKGTFMVLPFSKISSFTAATTGTYKSRDTTIYTNGIPQVILKLYDKLPVEEILHLLSSKIL